MCKIYCFKKHITLFQKIKKYLIKKKSNTFQKNDVLSISDPNEEDESLIMISGIGGEKSENSIKI